MTRTVAVVALAISLSLPLPAVPGGYDRTTWGMSVAQVQKLYPSGTVATTPGGFTVYRLSRRVDPVGQAYLIFTFADGVLMTVDVKIPRPGTVADPRKDEYVVTTDAQATSPGTTIRLAREKREGNLTDVILNYTDATWMKYPDE